MSTVIIENIEDSSDDIAEVGVTHYESGEKAKVTLDFDPQEFNNITCMAYTPAQARKLAAALILAADECEK